MSTGERPAGPAQSNVSTRSTRRKRGAKSGGKPTIKAVAERAGVAISTVSRVVNGGSASKAARQRVLEAIDALGYSPSIAAQSLVSRRAGCIGLCINSTQSAWFMQILAGVEEALASSRESVLLASLALDGTYDPSAVAGWIQEGRVDGLIFVRPGQRDEPLMKAAAKSGMPTVLIAPDATAPVEFIVRANNAEAGRLVAQHLLTLGHEHIAFAGGPRDSNDTLERLRGIRSMLAERGGAELVDVWFGHEYAVSAGEEYARRYLETPEQRRPTAVVLGNDSMALGFMRTVLHEGVDVPGDLSVAGFDGTSDGEVFWPSLTTVAQPTRLMAARACKALLNEIDGKQEPEPVVSLEYGVDLVVRESTGRPHEARGKGRRRS
jgi:DNA-binding LacI/PurR family transcriptional regulator